MQWIHFLSENRHSLDPQNPNYHTLNVYPFRLFHAALSEAESGKML